MCVKFYIDAAAAFAQKKEAGTAVPGRNHNAVPAGCGGLVPDIFQASAFQYKLFCRILNSFFVSNQQLQKSGENSFFSA